MTAVLPIVLYAAYIVWRAIVDRRHVQTAKAINARIDAQQVTIEELRALILTPNPNDRSTNT
jgi:uncharacterized membrane protein YjgN (DUF898 family)